MSKSLANVDRVDDEVEETRVDADDDGDDEYDDSDASTQELED
jgi:hypothetical protein